MKKLLLILMLGIFSCASSSSSDSAGAYNYESNVDIKTMRLMNAILEEYAPEATVYVMGKQPLGFMILGLANKVGPHTYTIQYASINPAVQETMFHEMGHIIDSERGRLDFRGGMKWEGKDCDFSQSWDKRPWEISANEWRDCLRYEYENKQLKHYNYQEEAFLEAINCITW